jgi:hypothetical protein
MEKRKLLHNAEQFGKEVEIMFKGLLTFATLLAAVLATSVSASAAEPAACEFVARDRVGSLLSELPIDVVGLANCAKRHPQASAFVITELRDINENELSEFVLAFARTLDHGSDSGRVTWQSKQPLDQRQLMITTETRGSKIQTSHYAFVTRDAVTGQRYLFLHSLESRATHIIRPTLDRLHEKLVTVEFLASLRPKPLMTAQTEPGPRPKR